MGDRCTRRSTLKAMAFGWPALSAAAADDGWTATGPGTLARHAVALLQAAGDDGLEPRDYRADALAARLDAAAEPPAVLAAELRRQFRRYLDDLHRGRVDPRRLQQDFAPPRADGFDAHARVEAARAPADLDAAVRAARPALPLYAQLMDALQRHRALVGHPAWRTPLPAGPAGARAPTPGDGWSGWAMVAERLALLGDLDAPASDAAAVDTALRGFQQRHGLEADGVPGPQTRRALELTPAARARQIALTMERLRWTPLAQGPRMIVVNVPEFVLRAYEWEAGRIVVRETMPVVVGRALRSRTPLFDEAMRFVEFSPYWNVPRSIAHDELVPQLRRDASAWVREGFEFVTGSGAVDTRLSAAGLDAAAAGRWRIRQRPGPRNALGGIKFVFPNDQAIYLHDTPAKGLFVRARRDFSHGCVRVGDPLALARFVLAPQPGWSDARIRDAMNAGVSATLRLTEPVPVLIAYGTVLVKQGRVHFFDDVYGHDRRLAEALSARPVDTPPSTPGPPR